MLFRSLKFEKYTENIMAQFTIDIATQGSDQAQADLDNLLRAAQSAGVQVDSLSESSTNLAGVLSSFAGNLAANAIALLAQQLTAIAQGSLEAGQKFETFRSVIENVTGSVVVADKELARITEFAATTPFQVDELVEAFIKLSNRGIQPSKIGRAHV